MYGTRKSSLPAKAMDRVNQETLARASNKSLINQGNFNSIELPLEGLSFLFCFGENKSKIQNETNKTDFMRSIKVEHYYR